MDENFNNNEAVLSDGDPANISDAPAKKRRKMKKFDKFTFVRELRSAPFVLFCIEAAYTIALLISGFNFLAVCAIAFSMGFALWTFIQTALRNYLNVWTAASFICSDASLLIYFFIWGAGTPAERFGYTILFTVLPIIAAVLILLFPKIFKKGGTRTLAALCAVFMLGVSVFYFLAGSFRAKPTVESMKDGHDDYLNSLGKYKDAEGNRPNILFVLMDDMGYSDISMYSYLGTEKATIQTPNIDSIARGAAALPSDSTSPRKQNMSAGIYFDNFYASSPVCSPSRFGILTGRYCSRGYLDNVVFPTKVSLSPFGSTRFFNPFQFLNNVDGILGDEITIAEVLSELGYSTALFGKWNLGDYGEYLPTNQGFDYFYGSHYVNDMTPYNFVEESGGQFKEVFSHAEMKDQSLTTGRISEKMDDYLQRQIEAYKTDKTPFFTYYCTPWPHAPLFSNRNGNGKNDTTDDSYIDCIEEFDEYLGNTLDLIYSDPEVADNTIVIFTSDNGPGREGATGALKGRKNTTFEGGHKVPMLINYGKNIRSTLYNESLGAYSIRSSYMNIDIFPTLLDYMGIPLPTDRIIDGVSMLGAITGQTDSNAMVTTREGEPRVLYYIKKGVVQSLQMPVEVDVLDEHGQPVLDGNNVKQRTYYDFKYYLNVRNENSAFIDQVYRNYLFNLDLDPIEGYNVAMTYPDAAAAMKKQLLSFRKQLTDNRRGIIR